MRAITWCLTTALATTLCGCPPAGPPETDTCLSPTAASVESIEIGTATLDSVFQPWMDGDQVEVVTGGQGSPMIPMRIRLRGSVGGCVLQSTTITASAPGTDAGIQLIENALGIYRQSDGSFVTNTYWLILGWEVLGWGAPPPGYTVVLSTTVANMTASRTLVLTQ